jgi:hypothetical protein
LHAGFERWLHALAAQAADSVCLKKPPRDLHAATSAKEPLLLDQALLAGSIESNDSSCLAMLCKLVMLLVMQMFRLCALYLSMRDQLLL